jgi:hypothetical protein
MPWKPGQSGNPSGRPKIPEATKKLLEEGGPEAFAFWLDSLRNPETTWPQKDKAAERLASYWIGKPREMIDLDVEGRIDGFTVNIVKRTNAGD